LSSGDVDDKEIGMMPTITVDDEVFAYLQSKATPFVDTPNAVLRRELPIGAPTSATPSDDIYADFPRTFRDPPQMLRDSRTSDLRKLSGGDGT
jgi:hypothetical protein